MSNVIKQLMITEKSTDLQAEGKYVFMVTPTAGKRQVAEEVEEHYNVSVVDVNTMNRTSRAKRWMRNPGKGKRYKKAIVTLKEGDSITLQ